MGRNECAESPFLPVESRGKVGVLRAEPPDDREVPLPLAAVYDIYHHLSVLALKLQQGGLTEQEARRQLQDLKMRARAQLVQHQD